MVPDEEVHIPSMRDVRFADGAWQIMVRDQWLNVCNHHGEMAVLLPGWEAKASLTFLDKAFLLLLLHSNGHQAAWVLDSAAHFVADLNNLTPGHNAHVYEIISNSAATLVWDAFIDLTIFQLDGKWGIFRHLHDNVLQSFLRQSSAMPMNLALLSLPPSLVLGGSARPVTITKEAVLQVLRQPIDLLEASAEAGYPALPALFENGYVDSAYMVARDGFFPVYRCEEHAAGLCYYTVFKTGIPTTLLFPKLGLLISEAPLSTGEISDIFVNMTTDIFRLVRILSENVPTFPRDQPRQIGILTSGLLNFGHVIWDEMQALERMLDVLPASAPRPWLYFVQRQSGLDLYAPAEQIYPEFSGHIVRLNSEAHIMAHAIRAGVELILRPGRRAMAASRVRLERVTQQTAIEQAFSMRRNARGAVITFGIRLTNRTPMNLISLYSKLARAIYDRIGSFTIVLDGINGTASGAAATYLYNVDKASNAERVGLRDGSQELQTEIEWTDSFKTELADLDVDVIDCIGMPILENLYWIQRSAFFVAPFGGGLAKTRWAADIPGFVLCSRTNLEKCSLLHAYDDISQMDEPFTALYFNAPDDVMDLPLDPPRTTPAPLHGIPHPENFEIIDSDRLISNILEAATAYISRLEHAVI
jgi:hypothetical protein